MLCASCPQGIHKLLPAYSWALGAVEGKASTSRGIALLALASLGMCIGVG